MFKHLKEKWLSNQEKKLKDEFKERLDKLWLDSTVKEHENKKKIEDIEQRLSHQLNQLKLDEEVAQRRRDELAKESEALKEQLKLIEAKAHPSSVWCEAFGQGHSKAWESMKEVVYRDFENVKKMIYEKAVEETLNANPRIKNAAEIKLKVEDLEVRRAKEKEQINIDQYSNYIEALNWILNDNSKNK